MCRDANPMQWGTNEESNGIPFGIARRASLCSARSSVRLWCDRPSAVYETGHPARRQKHTQCFSFLVELLADGRSRRQGGCPEPAWHLVPLEQE